ncbi:LysR family transcriptional regulator [Anaerotignum sp.]|uniref:LysR family transcriptional regulator n=1 Tax=Anaerotignum sp. TaxID=2039241 RepID=UPI002A9178E2|nr:LysR family transcriptional regulator [Anaerotignum sp.]MCI7656583.1 LysR family transcriptional regulator [Clostridia bacterium]MDY5414606.1 LysR family transcriptional regulator [Anaerotignum sp.]
MKIEQIRQVLRIYQSGSINKAAQNLFLSQPYISNSLKSLERELQQKIFIRSYNGIQLTEFGKIFIQNAQGLLKYADQIEYAAKDFSSAQIPLSFSVSVSYLLFAQAVFRNLMEQHENAAVNFRYNQTSVSEILMDVYDRSVELGLISIPTIDKSKWLAKMEIDDLVFEPIYSSKPAAMFSVHHGIENGKTEISLKELHEFPMTIISEKLPILDMVNKKMRAIMGAKTLIEVNDRTTAHEFIQSKNAYACVANCTPAYKNVPFFSYAKVLPIKDTPFDFEIGWVYRKDTYHSALAVEFMQQIEALLKSEI